MCTEEEKEVDEKRVGVHRIFRMLLVLMAASKEPLVASRPLGCSGWVRISPHWSA